MLPNCLIIGPAKCATSSLHFYLNQHPQIQMSKKKECHYFCHQEIDVGLYEEKYWPVRSRDIYEGYFDHSDSVKVWGESSPMYLYYTQAASRIKDSIPDCRLIAVLRHPVQRAFSAYTHAVRDQLEDLSFLDAVAAERQRNAEKSITPLQAYVECGLYASKLKPYYDQFREDQIFVVPYEDLKNSLEGVLKRLCLFLDVDPDFQFQVRARLNRSGVPKRRWIQRMTQAACDDRFPYNVIKKPFTNSGWIRFVKGIEFWNYKLLHLDDADRSKLMPYFDDDVRQLDELLGTDFRTRWGFHPA